ncbi:efflux RND transporter permease subunit [Nitrosovibrio sp. Nv17]|uniref:efflux RND transporter permease subunit n=1 Tax=Nitrosovibrio sp. Nv17 TaxID=1855339 RepID=UPI000908F02E|nr:efflux RND transporter permease subunit [Nitrosovibrio sp. Nv17]SFW27132.1 multidrug efflux pump [Nitrosovibrio sp. Nv17]
MPPVVRSFNLSEWALAHRAFTSFLMAMLLLGGLFAYSRLGQREDPEYTFRVMIVKTLYPGAMAHEVEWQVTDRLEKKIQELPNLDFIRSYSKPGESVLFITPREDVPPRDIPGLWYQVRKKIGDIRTTLPPGVEGPFFNDEFGDTYSFIYAFSGEGFNYAELKTLVDSARQQILRVDDVEKVDLIGDQDERIYVEFEDKKLARLGLDAIGVTKAFKAQNDMAPAGILTTSRHDLSLRISGSFDSVDDISRLPLRLGEATFRIQDFATVRRGYVDPPRFKMRFNRREVIGIGITMNRKGDIQRLGAALADSIQHIRANLPVGVELEQVADQAKVVDLQMTDFMNTFLEALIAVLLVSFFVLGIRAGMVVALTVPLVLAGTLICMLLMDIDLHRMSLNALILGLGLLVDDAMIAIEMMARKLDEGWDRLRAAIHAYRATAFPMLTGTLISIAGFLPVGLARSQAGEYCVAISQVVGVSLLLSWLGAVVFTPFIGHAILRPRKADVRHDRFDTPFYNHLRSCVALCVTHRIKVLVGTVALFGAGILALLQTQHQFFPQSNRPEVMVDMWLPEGSSFARTEAAARRMEDILAQDEDIVHFTTYIGEGSPRFFLLIVQQLANVNLAQIVILTRDNIARERVITRIRQAFDSDFPDVRGRTMRLSVGPPIDYPLLFRVFGEDTGTVRAIADRVAAVVRDNPHTVDVNDDWHDRIPSMRLRLDQDKAQAVGARTSDLSQALQAHYSGLPIGQFREKDKLIDIVWRARQRTAPQELPETMVRMDNGQWAPVSQFVAMATGFEDGVRWRRNRFPAISIRADVVDGVLAPDVATAMLPRLESIATTLPTGYFIETGAAKEDAWTQQKAILIWVPLVFVVSFFLLMVHLQSPSRAAMVILTAPLGVIGAAFALLLLDAPFGFMALLGIISLAGMIMRNSVILVDQIAQDEMTGRDSWNAVIESTVRRFRPIMLTATAAILAMIPLSRNDFFGPQAIAIMGGLIVATILTIFFVPALYAAWFRITRERPLGTGSVSLERKQLK